MTIEKEKTEEDKKYIKNIINAFKNAGKALIIIIEEMADVSTSPERLVELAKQQNILVKFEKYWEDMNIYDEINKEEKENE
nr:MAG: hypothetical protein [uncultured archaeon]